MRAVVGADAHTLDGGVFAFGQLIDGDADMAAICGAVWWWSRYSISGSMWGGSLRMPAFSGTEMSMKRRGIVVP